jgi:outer membrane receptor for ferrienterochelin and colicins
MKKSVWLLGIIIASTQCFSQNVLKLVVRDSASKEAIPDVSVLVNNTGRTTAKDGSVIFPGFADGQYAVNVTAVGYLPRNFVLVLPDTSVQTIFLTRKTAVLEDVTVIATTRTNQRIENSPLKVEVLGKEAMD